MLYGGFFFDVKVVGEVIDVEVNMGVYYCFVYFLCMGVYVCVCSLWVLLSKGYVMC